MALVASTSDHIRRGITHLSLTDNAKTLATDLLDAIERNDKNEWSSLLVALSKEVAPDVLRELLKGQGA